MSKTVILSSTCPYCGQVLDRITGAGDERPKAGSLTICAQCFRISEFNENLKMRRFDMNRLTPDSRENLRKVVRHMRALDKLSKAN